MAAEYDPPGSFPDPTATPYGQSAWSQGAPGPGPAGPSGASGWMPPLPPQAGPQPTLPSVAPPPIPVTSGTGATATAAPPAPAAQSAKSQKPPREPKEPADRSKLIIAGVIGVAVLVILGVVGLVAYPNIAATIVAGDRNRFQKSADQFTESLNAWQSAIEKLSPSEWSNAKSTASSDLEAMQTAQKQMASSSAKLSGKPGDIAKVMVETSGKIVRDADDVLAAMADGRPNDVKRAGEALKTDTDAYNAAVKEWNALG